jgi:hypothetical protein
MSEEKREGGRITLEQAQHCLIGIAVRSLFVVGEHLHWQHMLNDSAIKITEPTPATISREQLHGIIMDRMNEEFGVKAERVAIVEATQLREQAEALERRAKQEPPPPPPKDIVWPSSLVKSG